MSKSKMKKKVAEKNSRPAQKQPEKKRTWVKAKDFQFLKPVKFLPGFRSGKHWKRIVALMYFCAIPFVMVLRFGELRYFGVFLYVMLLAAPFVIMSLISFIKTKDKFYAFEALIAAAIVGADNMLLVKTLQDLMNKLG